MDVMCCVFPAILLMMLLSPDVLRVLFCDGFWIDKCGSVAFLTSCRHRDCMHRKRWYCQNYVIILTVPSS